MTVNASGRSALILAAGLLAGLFGSSLLSAPSKAAAASALESGHAAAIPHARRAHHLKFSAHGKSRKEALKSSVGSKVVSTVRAEGPSEIPPSVADANAELTSTAPVDNAPGLAAQGNQIAAQPAAQQVVSPDQLNALDREMQPGTVPPATVASTDSPAAVAEAVASGANETSNGDRTSLIGEIFIGAGVLLTIGSAARMFMA
jgi:hypothetical protein